MQRETDWFNARRVWSRLGKPATASLKGEKKRKMKITLLNGDCLEEIKKIPSESSDVS